MKLQQKMANRYLKAWKQNLGVEKDVKKFCDYLKITKRTTQEDTHGIYKLYVMKGRELGEWSNISEIILIEHIKTCKDIAKSTFA